MDAYLSRLVDQKAHAWERAKEIMNSAADENRDLTPEEDTALEAAQTGLKRYTDEIKRVQDMEALVAATDNIREQAAKAREERAPKRGETDADRLTALYRGEIRDFESSVTIPLGIQARALQSAGGSAIPTTFADFVTVYERTLNPMMDVATVIPTRTGNPIVLPRVTADVTAGGSVTAEAGGITEGDPTISTVTLNAFKKAHTTVWSYELDQDEVIGLDQIIANAIARPIGLGWGTDFTTGGGSTTANGFITAATNGGTANGTALAQATDTFFSAFDLIDLYMGLQAPYRQNASWLASNTGVTKMYKFRDSTGNLLYLPSLVPGAPDTFMGRPVYENPAQAAVASASKSVAVGDFSKYVIRDVSPMRVDLSKDYKFNTDELALRVVTRRDGDLPDATAIRYLVSANT